jgi:mannonate dehydratase
VIEHHPPVCSGCGEPLTLAHDFAYDRASFRTMLERYAGIGVDEMRDNLVAFVREIAAVAEEEGARLAIHPDDAAFPIFGLAREFGPRVHFVHLRNVKREADGSF